MDLIPYIPITLVFIMKMFCFLIGYLTIKLGYNLITNGIEGKFNFTAQYKGIKGGLISSSPGLLFVLLGIMIIGYAIYINKPYTIDSRSGSNEIYTPPDIAGIDSIP